LKRYEEAIQCYDKTIDRYKKNYEDLMFSYTEKTVYNEAIESYDEVIKKNPNNNNNTDLWYNKGYFFCYQ
jgi:tetratricopeptide (TPR) repeat protein